MIENKALDLAWNFVEKTDRNIFLTGKAGTGKTTFLRKIKYESKKRLIVVAPTGVAAINARGVTIHSFFQMPFGPILPNAEQQQTKQNFRQKFSKQKIDLIRSLDLVIIDEISMVRADLLDGIDQVLRRYKDRNKVFGGTQILMIGDLQQLSPVIKQHEWELLKPYYKTIYFFSSIAFREADAIGIELQHIYRQDNVDFIKILNEIRNNKLTTASAEKLNERYLPDFAPKEDEGYITLTTHNSRANKMNDIELNKIKTRSYFYKAVVKGKFSEYSYPTHEKLELKLGAQVMFVKNDSALEKRYFNGKIGKITHLTKDEITVHCPNDDEEIIVTPELWENISYAIDPQTKAVSENFQGSFSQIPLKLAWAITIHKSQGLTFDKAIIDAQASFVHGQTYVALSRCRTLEGVVLKTPIEATSIINDAQVSSFTKSVAENVPNEQEFNASQKKYQLNLIEELFNFYDFLFPIKRLIAVYYKHKTSLKGSIITPLTTIKDKGIIPLIKVNVGFKMQLEEMSVGAILPEKNEAVKKRFAKAVSYFTAQVEENISVPLKALSYATENKAVEKDFRKQLEILEEKLAYKSYCLKGMSAGFNAQKYLTLRAEAVLQKTKTTSKKTTYKDTTAHPFLFAELRELRSIISTTEGIPPFQVFTQQTLYEMCEYFPTTDKQLLALHGMGKIRVSKYGDEILDVITQYVSKNKITPKSKTVTKTIKKIKKESPKKGSSNTLSLKLFKTGMSIAEIAESRGLVIGTITSHLSQFIKTGEVKIEELMPKKRYQELQNSVGEAKFKSLLELKSKVDDKFTYSELQMLLNNQEYHKNNK